MGGAEQLKLMMLRMDAYCERNRLNRVSGNLINAYKGWFTRIVGLREARLPEVEQELDKIGEGNCKVVVFEGERVLAVYDRNLRLRGEDIRRLGLEVLW
jgi:hypothetical protein